MKRQFTEITTYDTKKTYRYPQLEESKNPQLWEVKLRVGLVRRTGSTMYELVGEDSIYLERQTLEKAGLVPVCSSEKLPESTMKAKTPEDLILELLEVVGVFPTEE